MVHVDIPSPRLVLVLVLHNCAVTVSSTGAGNQFQADDNGHVGRSCEVSLAPPYPEPFASYGASAVTQARTSGRGHVAEAKTNVIEVSGFSIMVSPSPGHFANCQAPKFRFYRPY
jgi:hypothetical protein